MYFSRYASDIDLHELKDCAVIDRIRMNARQIAKPGHRE
jgi:hypothetical protein